MGGVGNLMKDSFSWRSIAEKHLEVYVAFEGCSELNIPTLFT